MAYDKDDVPSESVKTPLDRKNDSVTAPVSTRSSWASLDGPNTQIFWVEMGAEYSAASLARSWREGRISPDAPMEIVGTRMTFRQLCLNVPWLRAEVGFLPDSTPTRRSFWGDLKFRLGAWRKVVKNGELGPALLAERIERLVQELEMAKNRLHRMEKLLESALSREKELVAAILAGAEDARELVSIFNACARPRTALSAEGGNCSELYQILERLAENLRTKLTEVANHCRPIQPKRTCMTPHKASLFVETDDYIESV